MALDRADFYDAELAQHNRHLRIAAAVRADDRVLDIGCGAGQTTREAARAATQGEAVGLDISAEMLEEARRRSAAERLRNVVFEQGDAQFHAFPTGGFDLCISRFGVMFFADPAAAFANIGRAMRPGARLGGWCGRAGSVTSGLAPSGKPWPPQLRFPQVPPPRFHWAIPRWPRTF